MFIKMESKIHVIIMAQIMAEGVSKKVTAATWLETAALEARNAAATLGISLLISGGAALITSLTHAPLLRVSDSSKPY